MTIERIADDDAALDAALDALPVPELPEELRLRLHAIPERSNVRRFPARVVRWPAAIGWAAAAALGLFIGAQTIEGEAADAGAVTAVDSGEDETLELAVGSFAEFGEEP